MAGRREPTFHATGQDDPQSISHPAHPVHAAANASHFTKFVSGFQALSTMIGVPIALASGYTLYKANFAPDTTCINLRTSIVSMLDKNVDPATRRALVKRDVETFEANCAAVDPDAQAAFRALLQADKPAAQAAKAAAPAPVAKPAVKEVAVKEPVKTELRPAIVEKAQVEKAPAEKPVAAVAPAADPVAEQIKADARMDAARIEAAKIESAKTEAAKVETAKTDTAISDTRWLDAVRSALVEKPGDAKEAASEAAGSQPKNVAKAEWREAPKPQPVVAGKPGEPVLQPGWGAAAPAAQAAALPPPVPVSDVARGPSASNRPVPPGSVPTAQYANNGSWVANIPFVGRIIDRSGE